MITARKSRWFEKLFAIYNRNLIARRFEGLQVAGLENLRNRKRDAPLLLYANHSSWWDGLMILQVGRAGNLEQYAMMEERQLRRYSFHRKLGAFSVVRENPREALRSIEYGGQLLRNTDRALWIFPQGDTLPNDVRPLKLYAGAARIVEQAGRAYAAPVGLRYEFLNDFRPRAFVRIGRLQLVTVDNSFTTKRLTHLFTESLTGTLDHVRTDILRSTLTDYEEIVAPSRMG